jgi:hypothetical protein
VRDSGYESKLSGGSVQSEDRPNAKISAAACKPDASPYLFKRNFTSLLEKMRQGSRFWRYGVLAVDTCVHWNFGKSISFIDYTAYP